VLITSANDEKVMARARRQGAGFLKKPFLLPTWKRYCAAFTGCAP